MAEVDRVAHTHSGCATSHSRAAAGINVYEVCY